MKLITALIQSHKLEEVKDALAELGVAKMTVTNALGCGVQQGYSENYRGSVTEVKLLKKIRLDIAVTDEYVEKTIETIIQAARTEKKGAIGDGKIFVTTLDDCIRIRTGERGPEAIG